MPASGGFPHSPGQPDFTFQPVEHLHQHRREHHTATVFTAGLLKRIRQAAALRFRQLTGGSFNSDEWREAPRLINRLDAGSVVLYCGQPVAVPAVPESLPVSMTATSSPSGPVHAAIPVLPPCGPAGRKDSDFRPAALHIVSACSAPAGAGCRNGTGESAHHPCG